MYIYTLTYVYKYTQKTNNGNNTQTIATNLYTYLPLIRYSHSYILYSLSYIVFLYTHVYM